MRFISTPYGSRDLIRAATKHLKHLEKKKPAMPEMAFV